MELALQSPNTPVLHRGLLRRSSSQNSQATLIAPEVQAVDFCRSKPRLVGLEEQLYSLANSSASVVQVTETCLSLLLAGDSRDVFNVFCSCSWLDRFKDPVISKLFYELVNIEQDSNVLLLAELEKACEDLLRVLTHLETPNTLQLNVACLLCNLSRLNSLPSSHLEAVQSYLEEIARALWPYSLPSAPDLWASEAFCDAQCDVLKAYGKYLEEKCPVNTERTFQRINGKLISGDISQYARFRLLEIRELRSSGWKFSVAALNYYKVAYEKYKNQSKKDLPPSTDSERSKKNGFKRISSMGVSHSQTNSKSVTVLRISESELRKSCDDLQEPLCARDIHVGTKSEENDIMVDNRSLSSAHRIDLPLQPSTCLSHVKAFMKLVSSTSSVQDDMEEEKEMSEKGSVFPSVLGSTSSVTSSDEDNVNSRTQAGLEQATKACVAQNLPQGISERVSSPCNSDSSEEVFTSAVAGGKVTPAMHRGDCKKLRRPFKSDSSVSSVTESASVMAALSDSNLSNGADETTVVSSLSLELETPTCISGRGTSNEPHTVSTTTSVEDAHESGDGKDCSTKCPLENWRERKSSNSDEHVHAGGRSASQNWKRSLAEPQSNDTSASKENWREQMVNNCSSPDFWGSGSQSKNWREGKSLSVEDEKTHNLNSTPPSRGQPTCKRNSLGDIQFERQASNEKGKTTPSGGFGLPKQSSQDVEEASSDDQQESHKSELVEVQLSEEESQGLKWWRLAEIQNDTGCKLFHDKSQCAVVIKGDPLRCKTAKQRVYSAVAALQEEFGALVPLSDEILQHLQTEGRRMMAERLALCSGANIKMINDSQLFISGHRTCVNLAKQQLATIKVMLKYTDDPDVPSLDQQEEVEDAGEEETGKVEGLFATLEGRPRRSSQTDNSSADVKPGKGSLSREFLLRCASSPLAQQRPSDLSLDRTEDWVKQIVLVNGRKEDEILLEHTEKKGFGVPKGDSTSRRPSV